MATKTYEIPTTGGTKTVQADTKQAALASIGATPPSISATTKPTAPYNVPPPPQTGAATGITGGADASIESYNTLVSQIQADKAAKQKAADESFKNYEKTVNQVLGIQGSRQQVEDSLNVDELGKLNNDAFTALQASKRAQQVEVQQAIDAAGGLKEGAAQTVQALNRRYAFEQADLAIALDVSNRNYLAAQATADKKIAMQLEPLQTLLNFQKSFYEQSREDLSKAEQNQLQLLIAENERKYEEQRTSAETLQKTKLSLMQMAQENQAPAAVINAIQMSATPEAAIIAAGKYATDILGRQLKLEQIAAASRSNRVDTSKAPEVKTINGVDMQWNGSQWVPIAGGAGTEQATKAMEQINFLKSTAKSAKDLAGAAGPSAIKRILGDTFVGNTKFRQLEQYMNTLRVNVMALNTDPTIKKFFGPQMSNADVQLMTSAGTTLNAQALSPTQVKTEIGRLENLFGRMETALSNGAKVEQSGGRLVTAPDGTVIEIID